MNDKRPHPIDVNTFHLPSRIDGYEDDFWRVAAIELDPVSHGSRPTTLTLRCVWEFGLTRGNGQARPVAMLWHFDIPKSGAAPRLIAVVFECSGRLHRAFDADLARWMASHARRTWTAWLKRHPRKERAS